MKIFENSKVKQQCTELYGKTPSQVWVEEYLPEVAERENDAFDRRAERGNVANFMIANGNAVSDTQGHVGEIDPECDHKGRGKYGCQCGIIDWGESRSGSWHGVLDGALVSRSYGTLHYAMCATDTERQSWILSSMVPPRGRKGILGKDVPTWEPKATLYIDSRQVNAIDAMEQGELCKAQILDMIMECTEKTIAEHPGMVAADTFSTFCRSLGLGKHDYAEHVGRDARGRGGKVTERANR